MIKYCLFLLFLLLIICLIAKTIINVLDDISDIEIIFLSISISLSLLAVVSTCLALLGLFNIYLVFAFSIGVSFIFSYVKKGKKTFFDFIDHNTTKLLDYGIYIIALVGLIFFVMLPTKYMWAGRDYGVYLINAVHTAKTGSSLYKSDEVLNDYYEELDEVISLGYPGFYSSFDNEMGQNPGDINAQFLSLYWCFLALGYCVSGITGLIQISALFSFASVGLIYCIGKRISKSELVGLISATILLISPAQIWGSRITQSEQMLQMLFLLMSFLWIYAMQTKNKFAMHITVIFIGLCLFCRIDSYLIGIAFITELLISRFIMKDKLLCYWKLILHYLIWMFASILYGWNFHRQYVRSHFFDRGFDKLWYVTFALVLMYFILYLIVKVHKSTNQEKDWTEALFFNKVGINFVAFAMYTTILILYFASGRISFAYTGALKQFSYYFCPLLLIVFPIGICFALYQCDERKEQLLLIISGIAMILLYTVNPSITMDHYFMSRRWLPINNPFIILYGVYGLYVLWRSRNNKVSKIITRMFAVVILILTLGYLIKKDLILWNYQSCDGMEEEYEHLAERIPDDGIVLTRNEAVASALKYIYNKKIYMVKDNINEKQLLDFVKSGKEKIYYLGEFSGDMLWDTKITELSSDVISSMSVESCYDHYPEKYTMYYRDTSLYTMECYDETVDKENQKVYDKDKKSLLGYVVIPELAYMEADGIHIDGLGYGFFGPYSSMKVGNYEITAFVHCLDVGEEEPLGTLEVVFDEVVVESVKIYNEKEAICRFSSTNEAAKFQVRFLSECEKPMVCETLDIVQKN